MLSTAWLRISAAKEPQNLFSVVIMNDDDGKEGG